MLLPLFALLLGAFCIGTTELVVAGILPAIAADLGVIIPDAGLARLRLRDQRRLRRPGADGARRPLPAQARRSSACSCSSSSPTSAARMAPSFAALMAGRVVAAAAHGTFFGLAIVLATSSVPADRRATALSIVVGGIGVANILGVPLGAAVGNAFGWRATFVMIAVFALVAASPSPPSCPTPAAPAPRRRSATRSGRC